MEAIVLNGSSLSIRDLVDVAYRGRKVDVDAAAVERCERARQVLFDMAADGKPVYGLNHGVGWNKDREFGQDFFRQFNENLINSHSVGISPFCSVEEVRAMMCIRLNKALCGRTGISTKILLMYAELLNRGIHPRVLRRGAVGEGDVSTLALVGQTILGKGDVEYHGRIVPASDALRAENMAPVILGPKDGLSIVSSNAQGESIVLALLKETEDLLRLANASYCLMLEGLNGGLQPLAAPVNEIRGLAGQARCAAECRRLLKGSYLEEPDPHRALQDPLSFRCGAAVNGAVYDALQYVEGVFQTQINHSDDNPCIVFEESTTYVSPNFETTTLSLGTDMLAAALCHMSRMITNRLFRIVDPQFSNLSRFLSPDENRTICFSTIQKTISALDSENRWLSNTTSADYDVFANGIEDHASGLPLSAMRSLRIVDNLRYMIGLELMHAAQAIDLRGDLAKERIKLGKGTRMLKDAFREAVGFYDRDRNLSEDIEKAYCFVKSERTLQLVSSF